MPIVTTRGARFSFRRLLASIGALFPRNVRSDAIATTVHLDAPPEAVWRAIHFYEDVPRRPLLLLRIFLPRPVRTEGEKTTVGSIVQCTYDDGHLVKRITKVQAPSLVRFEVLEQRLGIERCVSMGDGSYEIRATEHGSELVLTTHYRGHLRPRWLWRAFERYLAHRLHRHILEGMKETLAVSSELLPVGHATCTNVRAWN